MPAGTARSCSRCQAVIPSEAPDGICVACLLRVVDRELPLGFEAEAARPGPPKSFPSTLGDYELLTEVGRGGMGVVFKVRQRRLNRYLALKLLAGGILASEADIVRFYHEAEAAAQLEHANIVPTYEVGEIDGLHYYAMRFVDGASLDQRLGRFRDDPKSAALLMSKVARAIHYAHQRGLLHRDLKPANILVDARGEPYVTDFGLAVRLDQRRSMTLSGRVVGTLAYLSPEQAQGIRGQVTVVSDVFSLGVILYELITGQLPFAAESDLAMLDRLRKDDPVPPSRLNAAVDVDLETICLTCLEKNPSKRYSSAGALADDLDLWLRGEPIHARSTAWHERSVRWIRRHPVRTIAILAIALVLTTPTAVASWFILHLNHSRGHHPERQLVGNVIDLPLFNWHRGRCTDNFPGKPFAERHQQRVRLELLGVPPEIRDSLKVQIRSDWAVLPDPAKSAILSNGTEFVLAVKVERKWLQDNLLYFERIGWDVGEVTAQYTNAAIRLTLIDRPKYDPRVPE